MRPLVTDAPTTAVHPSRRCLSHFMHVTLLTIIWTSPQQTEDKLRLSPMPEAGKVNQMPFQRGHMKFHQLSYRSEITESDLFAEIYNQASLLPFYYLLWGKWLQCLGAPAEQQWRRSAKNKNKAISSKYSSAFKSCQGQTCGRLLPRQNIISVSGCVPGEHS